MTGREAILGKVRASLAGKGDETSRRKAVEERLAGAPRGLVPARGQLDADARVELFCRLASSVAATVERVTHPESVPAAVTAYLRARNLAQSVRMGDDPRLAAMRWEEEKTLEVRRGRSDGHDEVGVSHAFAAVAETGTVLMTSGLDNPTTINFLPDHHLVVVRAADIEGDLESALARVRSRFGKGTMPRTLNMITGPSRSGDIEQKLLLGAHGPRALHLIVVDS